MADMRRWEIVSDGGVDALALNARPAPAPGPGEALVRVAASSVNYRDLSTIEDPVSRRLPYPTVPNSDAAGEVVALGPGVEGLAVGDRVATCFFQDWEAGEITPGAMASALGGARQGVLAEQVALPARGLIRFPDHLSMAEAATLPCAALTAWHALTEPRPMRPGETALLLGTGGVSVFAQQFCALMGVRTVATSSSDAKLERMKALGATHTINYRATPDWDAAAVELTGGRGPDRVVEVGGPGTLEKSVEATRVGGDRRADRCADGRGRQPSTPTAIMRKSITLRGVYVGSREMFAAMNRAIAAHELRPVIDKSFPFNDAREAYHAMHAAEHFGKLIIDV